MGCLTLSTGEGANRRADAGPGPCPLRRYSFLTLIKSGFEAFPAA